MTSKQPVSNKQFTRKQLPAAKISQLINTNAETMQRKWNIYTTNVQTQTNQNQK